MSKKRWAIVGTGGIAAAMAQTLREVDDAELVAVASPTDGRAATFAKQWGIPTAATSIDELPHVGIDAAYVASSNHRHLGDATALLAAGIPVLCEKPLTTTSYEAVRMVAVAREHDVFLMEAMWMRFLPFWDRLTDLIRNDAIGPPRLIRADFGFLADTDPSRRWFDPIQGGGALLDVGIYPVTFAVLLAGLPKSIRALGTRAGTGVDDQVGIVMRHGNDVLSVLGCSFSADTSDSAAVSGPKGRVELAAHFHNTAQLTLHRSDGETEVFDVGYEGSGYRFEVDEVHRCLDAGLSESSIRPLSDTLDVMGVLDEIRTTAFG